MHFWGDKDVDWAGISAAARYIGKNLRRWGRIGVRDYKEKYGTVRVYCSIGIRSLHNITHPGHCFSRYPKWLWSLDCLYFSRVIEKLNFIVVPYQKWLYRKVYSNAIKKWPHLREEILCAADFDEVLKGL